MIFEALTWPKLNITLVLYYPIGPKLTVADREKESIMEAGAEPGIILWGGLKESTKE